MTAFDALLTGRIPPQADRRTLRWLHHEHLWRARHPIPLGLSRHAHINAAGACRRAMGEMS